MFSLCLRTLIMAIIGLTLTTCASRPKPIPEVQQIYDLRAVAVTANEGISRTIMRGIKLRLDKAIIDTVRPIPMPHAVMNIHIVAVTKIKGQDGTRMETEVSVALTDVPSGQALLVRSFLVYSFSISDRDANESAAEAIASRLRVEYALSQPVIRIAPAPVQHLSTRMGDDTQQFVTRDDKPLVIPLKTAPVVGADEDPMLNSKTRITRDSTKEASLPEVKAVILEAKQKIVDHPADTDNAVESGAKAKVVIKLTPSKPAADEPCVETMEKKC